VCDVQPQTARTIDWASHDNIAFKQPKLPSSTTLLQDKRIMDTIASYFNRTIKEIEWDDEDGFLAALKESM